MTGPHNTAPKKVLFVCLGNSCRSQMAEGFARAYGSDVMAPLSAGLSAASIIQPLTHKVMEERNIRLDAQFPKNLDELQPGERFHLVINISGYPLPMNFGAAVETWKVPDPIGETIEVYRQVASQLESAVMSLVLRLRAEVQAAGAQRRKI